MNTLPKVFSIYPSFISTRFRHGLLITTTLMALQAGGVAHADDSYASSATVTGENLNAMAPGKITSDGASGLVTADGNNPRSMILGDVNGDGINDLITANYAHDNISVRLGHRDGTLQNKVDFATGARPFAVVLGDLNGDGVSDVVTVNYLDHSVSLLTGNGDGTFKTRMDYPVGDYPTSAALADVNHDGMHDLVIANAKDSQLTVLLGNGDGLFSDGIRYSPTQQPVSATPWHQLFADAQDKQPVTQIHAAKPSCKICGVWGFRDFSNNLITFTIARQGRNYTATSLTDVSLPLDGYCFDHSGQSYPYTYTFDASAISIDTAKHTISGSHRDTDSYGSYYSGEVIYANFTGKFNLKNTKLSLSFDEGHSVYICGDYGSASVTAVKLSN